jgi:ATP-dependent DNA helicase RecQ
VDAEQHGRVRLIAAPASANLQAQVVMQEVRRILGAAPGTPLGQIAVLARTHDSLQPLRALCDDTGMRFELVSSEAARSRVSFMRLREGWQTMQQLPGQRATLVDLPALQRWLAARVDEEPDNPHWADIAAAVDECAGAAQVEHITAQEVLDALHEACEDTRRGGHPQALRLITAHSAKGLEFDHVIVMDCGDWRWNGDETRRLLYVAMTRARLSLTLMRTEDGANAGLADLATVEGVASLLPRVRPTHRAELNRRYWTLSPADVDLGYAGRLPPRHPVHADIAALRVGDEIRIEQRQLRDHGGQVVGRLARKCDLPAGCGPGRVVAIMVRTRNQTPAEYQAGLQVDTWEVPLAEVVVS